MPAAHVGQVGTLRTSTLQGETVRERMGTAYSVSGRLQRLEKHYASCRRVDRTGCPHSFAPIERTVAYALVRAASRLISTPASSSRALRLCVTPC